MKIFKYALDIDAGDTVIHSCYHYFKPLAIGAQDGKLVMWVQVDPDDPVRGSWNTYRVIATGEDFKPEDDWEYIGTAQVYWFVAHVWLVKKVWK